MVDVGPRAQRGRHAPIEELAGALQVRAAGDAGAGLAQLGQLVGERAQQRCGRAEVVRREVRDFALDAGLQAKPAATVAELESVIVNRIRARDGRIARINSHVRRKKNDGPLSRCTLGTL